MDKKDSQKPRWYWRVLGFLGLKPEKQPSARARKILAALFLVLTFLGIGSIVWQLHQEVITLKLSPAEAIAAGFKQCVGLMFLSGVLFGWAYVVCWMVLYDLIATVQALWAAIKAIPSFCRNTGRMLRAGGRALVSAVVASGRFLRGVPALLASVPGHISAVKPATWAFIFVTALCFAFLAGGIYLLWGWAGAIYNWLPDWLSSGPPDRFHQFVSQLMIAFFMALIPWAICFALCMELVRALARRFRKHTR